MPSETIWSSTSTSPMQSNVTLNPQYKSVLDQVDPEVAKLFTNSNPLDSLNAAGASSSERRFSFNDGSDIDSNNLFGLKRGAFSAITAPVANTNNNNNNPNGKRINFGTASISGGITSRHPPQDSFLQKFSAVADATREIELGKLTLSDSPSRRTSFNENIKSIGVLSSPHGSLNENLNMPAPRSSRHQSISDKIDHYNNSSPIQTTAALSVNSDLNSNGGDQTANATQRFWNPAAATSFTPSSYNYFMDNGLPVPPPPPPQGPHLQGAVPPPPPPPQGFYRPGTNMMPPISPPPPFMIPSPPPQFMDPGLYNMMAYGSFPPVQQQQQQSEDTEEGNEVPTDKNQDEDKKDEQLKEKSSINVTGGIGLMNRQFSPASFMFQPFNPYSMYQQSPPPPPPPGQVPSGPVPPQTRMSPPPPHPPIPQASGPVPAAVAQSERTSNRTNTPPQSSGNGNQKRKGGSGLASTKGNKSSTPGGSGTGGGGNHIYRSPLLEEVRSNPKDKEFYLKDIYGHAIEFTKDQHGSRFIQTKLPQASDEEKEVIFNEIRDIAYELMTDVFGNYVIQKYFEFGTKTQKQVLLEQMLGHIYELSLQMYGCRVVQRALEAIELDGQIKIIEELRDHILVCSKDQNGNHVIQKSIEMIKPFNKIRFILTSLDSQIYHLSTHPYGCRVIQRLLEFSSLEDQKAILDELNRFIFYLIQDQYGNYVMQHILEHGKPDEREEILKVVLGSVVNFSKHKFASNVIEKCIKFGDVAQRKRILNEVMLDNLDYKVELVSDDSPLALMMKDQYANYVIQKLVEAFDGKSEEKRILVTKLRQYLKQISSKNNYGKHLASVEKMIIVAETALDEAR
ncbi:PUF3 [[Candida] subhashii]|uniref:Pumilio homology domain family member 3 n=1 Tax=[Candida] subhashii TaxID=561895 RepID=A0A8J5UF38_9ASCO|nr:PUF3 [[Candida] subhashii]KAG7661713.1 PUF3 [[Candida] subhashii]